MKGNSQIPYIAYWCLARVQINLIFAKFKLIFYYQGRIALPALVGLQRYLLWK